MAWNVNHINLCQYCFVKLHKCNLLKDTRKHTNIADLFSIYNFFFFCLFIVFCSLLFLHENGVRKYKLQVCIAAVPTICKIARPRIYRMDENEENQEQKKKMFSPMQFVYD